jgi:hypothetical protein
MLELSLLASLTEASLAVPLDLHQLEVANPVP